MSKRGNNALEMKYYILITVYVVISVSGLVLFKLGSQKAFGLSVSGGAFSMSIHGVAALGLLFYMCSFLLYMFLVSKFDLSYLAPISAGAIYVLTFAASVFVFKEKPTLTQDIGAALIMVGVILLNIKK